MNSQMYDLDRTESFKNVFDQFTDGLDPAVAAFGENPFETYNNTGEQEESQGGEVGWGEDSMKPGEKDDDIFKFN